ncbi:restriction endonuclease subunit S [Hydrogenophaga laconesensis]|uniref:Type I restriction enzyme S subunit n=1 Tax=Hydrogenophaga laconesensis TaxID=1805971 RepID=A0ABU1VCH9_9BURK|nr:restriction endonuclease subunit S [Hydrogenophaga laconesensis]MDR7095157.1 type I restriction enzyme S subunit [Hydrogenophaga laconesensis]
MRLFEASLPHQWKWSRFGDHFEITRKPRGMTLAAQELTFLPMDAVPQNGAYEPDSYFVRRVEDISSGTYFERGNLLVAKITPSFENGKQALASALPGDFGYATTEVIPLRPKGPTSDIRLAFFYLLHPEVRSFVAERMEGTTGRQRVPEAVLLDLPYPSLPADHQHRIARSLEQVQSALRIEASALEAAQKLKKSALEALFAQGLHRAPLIESEIGPLPASWDAVPLGSLGRVGNGSTPKRTISEYWNGGAYPWLTSSKVYDRNITKGDQFVTETALRECHLPKIQPGALLIAITGQGKTLGHCAVLRTEATVSQHVAYVQTDTTRANPVFLRGYLETQYDYLRQVGAGGGSTKGALTCAFLRSLPVPLPPLAEQNEIAEVLDAIDAKMALHQQKQAVLEELFKALLHKLMTGEIDVNDLDLSALQPAT